MRNFLCVTALGALLLGGCAVVDAAKPKLDNAYDKALAAWCVLLKSGFESLRLCTILITRSR